jgi:hypothetical protein
MFQMYFNEHYIYIYQLWPRPGGRTSTLRTNEILTFGKGLSALYYNAFTFSIFFKMCISVDFFFSNWSLIGSFGEGGNGPEIYHLCPSCRKDVYSKFKKNWTGSYQEIKNVQVLMDTRRRASHDNLNMALLGLSHYNAKRQRCVDV